jgi:hypothetical protein
LANDLSPDERGLALVLLVLLVVPARERDLLVGEELPPGGRRGLDDLHGLPRQNAFVRNIHWCDTWTVTTRPACYGIMAGLHVACVKGAEDWTMDEERREPAKDVRTICGWCGKAAVVEPERATEILEAVAGSGEPCRA